MLIKNLAFKVDIPSWTTTTQYVDYLISKNCQTFGISDEYLIAIHRDQIMINNVQTPICSGVILRTKDARTFTTLADANGSLTVEAEELEDGTSIVDFNHFIINENNGMGIYQHYYQSVTLPGFLKILGRQFHDFESTPTNRVIDKSGCDPFNVEQYMTQAGLSEMVSAMNKITKVEYKLVASAEDSRFGIPNNDLKYTRKTVAYDPKTTTLGSIINKIRSQLRTNTNDYEQVWVTGKSGDGEDVVYKMAQDYGCFWKEDYDETARSLHLDLHDSNSSLTSNHTLHRIKNKIVQLPEVGAFFTA